MEVCSVALPWVDGLYSMQFAELHHLATWSLIGLNIRIPPVSNGVISTRPDVGDPCRSSLGDGDDER